MLRCIGDYIKNVCYSESVAFYNLLTKILLKPDFQMSYQKNWIESKNICIKIHTQMVSVRVREESVCSLKVKGPFSRQQEIIRKRGSDGIQVWSFTLMYESMRECRNIYCSRVMRWRTSRVGWQTGD